MSYYAALSQGAFDRPRVDFRLAKRRTNRSYKATTEYRRELCTSSYIHCIIAYVLCTLCTYVLLLLLLLLKLLTSVFLPISIGRQLQNCICLLYLCTDKIASSIASSSKLMLHTHYRRPLAGSSSCSLSHRFPLQASFLSFLASRRTKASIYGRSPSMYPHKR